METESNTFEATLLRYFAGETSVQENQDVETWINESDENKKLSERIYYIYRATELRNDLQTIDAHSALRRVNIKLKRQKLHTIFRHIQRIAALLFIPLLLLYMYQETKEGDNDMIEMKTTPGMIATLTLPDQTEVCLNSKSTLRYPARFSGKQREVYLDGEAFFTVKKDKKKFLVNTAQNFQVEVLGTRFNVEAYKQDSWVRTTLVSGSVQVNYNTTETEPGTFILKPGEACLYDMKTKKINVGETPTDVITCWKEGTIVLDNTPLKEVLHMLKKKFNVTFIVKNDQLNEYCFRGSFANQPLETILEHFKISSGIHYHIIAPTDQAKTNKETIVELK